MSLKWIAACAACIATVLAWLYVWHGSERVSNEAAVLRAENDQRREEIDRLVGSLEQVRSELQAANANLAQANRKLDGQDRELELLRGVLHAERDRRVTEVPNLTLGAAAGATAAELKIEPIEIRPANDTLIFSESAARANLRALIIGTAAIQELPLAGQQIGNLKEQIANLRIINSNLDTLLANKDIEMRAALERAALQQAEADKELKVQKAKARKGHFVSGLVGFVVGAVLVAL